MNPYIDADLIAIADQARRFATERVAPGFQERDRTRVLNRMLMREMGALGFIAPELPEIGPRRRRRQARRLVPIELVHYRNI